MDTSTHHPSCPHMDHPDYPRDERPRSFRRHFSDIKPPSALRIGHIKPLSLQPKRSPTYPQSRASDSILNYNKPPHQESNDNINDTHKILNSPTTFLPPTSIATTSTTNSTTPDDPTNLTGSASNALTRADIIRHIQLKKFLEAFIRRRKNLKTELEDRLRLLKQEAKNNRRRRQNVFFYPSAASAASEASSAANGNNNMSSMLDLQKEQRIDGLVEERIRLAHETYEQQLALLINEFVVVGLREEVLRVI
ncbi:hypothetical protein B0T09DRAFT_258426 [Sordaria sp. MPI-SDFR-AT-0083]|nr:hypothetical protein B0T09DRAFT_258426 [Sordaria sp. MPI-SDFR-AT-0083]